MPATSQKPEAASRNAPSSATNARPGTSGAGTTTTSSATDSAAKTTNKPSDSRFKQQKLKAWQPILTAGTVLPTFFVIGVIFVPVGVVLLITSNNVREYVFDYTDSCIAKARQLPGLEVDTPCKDVLANETLRSMLPGGVCECEIVVYVEQDVEKPVYIYYGLTNFYQNHRRYVKSRDDAQLLGDITHTVKDCRPFETDSSTNETLKIVPCGAVANSMFNDTFSVSRQTTDGRNSQSEPVGLLYNDIAWPSDRNKKFVNPSGGWKNVDKKKIAKPPNWGKPIYELNTVDEGQNGFKNESFIVWMRTAALPTFRKLHSRVNHDGVFKDGLPAGNYTITIGYSYPVDSFDGHKRFIISNTSWAGGKNPFLGVAYIVVGSLCILTGFIFLLIHIKFGKSLTELATMN